MNECLRPVLSDRDSAVLAESYRLLKAKAWVSGLAVATVRDREAERAREMQRQRELAAVLLGDV